MKNHAGHEYFELQVIRLETGNRDDYKIIMGFRYIDDIVQEDMKKEEADGSDYGRSEDE